ncbi:MAG: hypothetical protein QT08_C0003G0009 [archaeon GW2011_AR17]|nr:MAG: hypothetical protein QT08_C0003G0009 [archaeon GW2011_AR17]MBS3154673.1 hypothetical protein [Candidatus Woesearchaeota archaeon]HIH15002.1 hypothetical protein [Nanoarchaeota archaeon]HIH58730.1 hypothetical protein [Nanoarchaeota archaeon]HIJ05346.1 hypothetical protein [Nanoarchaeota archaeon]
MAVSLRVYERSLPSGAKKWQQKIIGVIRLDHTVKKFIFGRNEQTKYFIPNINTYTFLDPDEGEFIMGEKGMYKFADTGKNGIALRTNLSFWILNLGPRETMLEKNDLTQMKVGDQLIMRDETARKEIVLEIIQIY